MKNFTKFFIFFFLPMTVQAEYRVYQYLSKSAPNIEAKSITTTLDPVSFHAYYPGSKSNLSLLRTWICVGHTGKFKPVCPSPYERAQKEDKASQQVTL